ncbi:hypothetical protein V5799_002169 [Amblyomma americanum]|uniref:Uncharacterized protein n=1 Tax=Amblyomma americanum TaxID=6943 RepID=A0AAQ4CY39_AMBAM
MLREQEIDADGEPASAVKQNGAPEKRANARGAHYSSLPSERDAAAGAMMVSRPRSPPERLVSPSLEAADLKQGLCQRRALEQGAGGLLACSGCRGLIRERFYLQARCFPRAAIALLSACAVEVVDVLPRPSRSAVRARATRTFFGVGPDCARDQIFLRKPDEPWFSSALCSNLNDRRNTMTRTDV